MKQTWIRQDKETGRESEMTVSAVREMLKGYYKNVKTIMDAATKDNPATTGFSNYWPKS